MKHAIGKTVARVATRKEQLTTFSRTKATVISAIIFTDGSRITFRATEVEHGDPVPLATYRGKPRSP